MDYKSAEKHFTKQSPLRRRLDGLRNTWLHRDNVSGSEPISVRLFRTDIITFLVDGSFSLNTNGYMTATTKDRFRRYLPKGCWVSMERLFNRECIAYLCTPKGVRPVYNDARFSENFERVDLKGMNSRDAGSVRHRILEYVKAYIHRLIYKGLPAPLRAGDCLQCHRHAGELAFWNKTDDEEHYLEHLDSGTMPPMLIVNALYNRPPRLLEAAESFFMNARHLWKPDHRTLRGRLLQAEAALMGKEPLPDPRNSRGELREALENFLLDRVGFERIDPHQDLFQGMNKGATTRQLMGW